MSQLVSFPCTLALVFSLLPSLQEGAAVAQPTALVTTERIQSGRYPGDPLAVKSLNPTYDLFPDASLIDFSYLLDPPAGKHGFVGVGRDGRLQFDNGRPARFWGVVIDQQNVNIPKYMIDIVVEALARAGVNIIRLHSLDNRTGEKYGIVRHNIIDEAYPHHTTSQFIDEDFRDRVDYWIGASKKRGIYTYLGFRAYRTFREEDGVVNADSLDRGARPYAIFNQRLIELQKEFIDSFAVFHVNPYTGLSYANDPAVVCFEVVNEDDMLFRPEVWSRMPEPYWTEINGRWNAWLLDRYRTTAKLKAAWSNHAGVSALAAHESLEKKNIRLPNMEMRSVEPKIPAPYYDPLRSPPRRSDAVRFAIDLQMRYFREIRNHCVARGVRVPLTAVVRSDLRPMTFTVQAGLDMTAGNAYFDHPSFLPGKEWMGQEFFTNKNYLTEIGAWSFAPSIAQYHWNRRPAAIREWSTCWPNAYRGSSVLETAAYSLFQGFDLVTHFNYTTTGHFTGIGTFGLQADPVRWGMFGLASKMFLTGDVKEAERTIAVLFSEKDLTTYGTYESPVYQLAWIHRVVNSMVFDSATYDFTITAGFRDSVRNVLAVGGIPESDVLSLVVRMLHGTYRTATLPERSDQKILHSDTRELTRNAGEGYMVINTKSFCAVQGVLGVGRRYDAGTLSVASQSPVAVVAATSLDNRPLEESSLFVVKMLTVAENHGQMLDTVNVPPLGRRVALRSRGGFPVVTRGVATDKPTSVWLDGKRIVDVYLVNGTWEILFDLKANRYAIYCDTPNIRFHIYPDAEPKDFKLTRYLYGRQPLAPQEVQNDFVYPGFSKYVVLGE